jgi:O-antigen/teichoic acid export membrane protein
MTSETLRTRLLHSSVAQTALTRAAGLSVSVCATFLSIHLIIRYMGPYPYAAISLIAALVAFFPVADLGTGAAVTTAVASESALRVRETISVAFRTTTLVGLAVTLFSLCIASLNLWPSMLHLTSLSGHQTNYAAVLVATLFAVLAPLSISQRILLGLHAAPLIAAITAAQAVLALAFTGILVVANAPVWLFAGTMLAAQVAGAALMLRVAFSRLGQERSPTLATVTRRTNTHREHQSAAIPALIVTLSLTIALQSDRLVIAHFSTATNLAQYSIGAQVYATIWSLVGSVGATLWPIFRREISAGNLGLAQVLLRRYTWGFGVMGFGFASVLVFGLPEVAGLLTDNRIEQPLLLRLAFAALIVVQAVQYPSGMYLTGARGLRFQAFTTSIMLPVNLALSIPLTHVLGAPGPLLGSAMSILVLQLVPCSFVARRGAILT